MTNQPETSLTPPNNISLRFLLFSLPHEGGACFEKMTAFIPGLGKAGSPEGEHSKGRHVRAWD